MPKHDIENSNVRSKTMLEIQQNNFSSWSSWTNHANQWLKGGAMVLGTALLGGLTYMVGRNFGEKPSVKEIITGSSDGLALANEHTSALEAKANGIALSSSNLGNIIAPLKITTEQGSNSQVISSTPADLAESKKLTQQSGNLDLELSYPGANKEEKRGAQKRGVLDDFQVNTYTISSQVRPVVAGLADGGFVVAWISYDQDFSGQGIYGQRYDTNGTTQGTEFRINTYTLGPQMNPSIASLINGGFVVAWESGDGSGYGLYGQRYDVNGISQGEEFRINTYTTGDQSNSSIAGLTSGDFVVVWQGNLPYKDIYGQRYDANGIRQGVEFQVNTCMTDNQMSPRIASLANGGFVVVWHSYLQDGSGYGIYGQIYDTNGISQGAEFRVNTYTTNDQRDPSITSLANGGFAIVWCSVLQDGSSSSIYAQRYDANGLPQGVEFRVNTDNTYSQDDPSIVGLTNGGFVVVWTKSTFSLHGQRYDVNGISQGAEFLVSTYTHESTSYPSTASLMNGEFIVVWESTWRDGDGGGVYGKICNNNAPIFNNSIAPDLTVIDEDATNSAGDTVATIVGSAITDPDGVAVQAIAITAVNNVNGAWQYSVDTGSSWSAIAPVSGASSLLLDSAHKIRFVPNADFNGQSTFTFRAWDKTSGTAGNKVSTDVNGGISAFSAETGTATITINSVNDAPIYSTSIAPVLTTINEDVTNPAGNTVATIVGSAITDPDGVAAKAIAVTDVNNANGVWQCSLDGGSSWSAIAPASGASSLLLDSAHKIRFVPNADFNGQSTFTFRAWDKTSGIAGSKVSTSVYGGSSAFSTAIGTATVTINSVNDAPIYNTAATPTLTAIDEDVINPTGDTVATIVGSAITDPDGVAAKAIAITDVNNANGAWQCSLDGGSSWSAIAPVSGASSLLLDSAHKIRFVPNADFNGQSTFTFRAWDKTSGTAGNKVSTNGNGDISAFSAEVGTAIIIINSANEAPIYNIAATPTLTAIDEDVINPTGDTVATIVGSAITDPDGVAAKAIAITDVNNANGVWQCSLDGGSSWSAIAPVSGASSLLLDSAHKIRFVPNADFNGQSTFTFRAWDKTSGTAGSKVSTNVYGGSSAFSSAIGTATITVNAISESHNDENDNKNDSKTTVTENVTLNVTLITVGGLAIIASITGALCYLRRKKHKDNDAPNNPVRDIELATRQQQSPFPVAVKCPIPTNASPTSSASAPAYSIEMDQTLPTYSTVMRPSAPPCSMLSLENTASLPSAATVHEDASKVQKSYLINYDKLTFGAELGQGGFGVVYKGTYEHGDVAIKKLLVNRMFAASEAEFQKEISITASLRHPNIVTFFGYTVSPYCMVMELMTSNLYDVLHNDQELPWSMRFTIAQDIIAGLVHLHENNILHRDLKSLNVLLNANGRAKLTDFGLSQVKAETRITTKVNGGASGTLQWMAPELFNLKAKYGSQADIYSYAMVLWELATRALPYGNADPYVIISEIKQGNREEIPNDCPTKIASLIKSCWHQEANKRPNAQQVAGFFQSAAEKFEEYEATPSFYTAHT